MKTKGIILINLYDFEKVTTYKLQIWIYFTFSKVKAGTRSSSTDCKQSRQTDSSKTKRCTEFDSTVAISQTLFYTQTHRQFFKWLLILELFLYSYVFTNSILLLLFHRLLYTPGSTDTRSSIFQMTLDSGTIFICTPTFSRIWFYCCYFTDFYTHSFSNDSWFWNYFYTPTFSRNFSPMFQTTLVSWLFSCCVFTKYSVRVLCKNFDNFSKWLDVSFNLLWTVCRFVAVVRHFWFLLNSKFKIWP